VPIGPVPPVGEHYLPAIDRLAKRSLPDADSGSGMARIYWLFTSDDFDPWSSAVITASLRDCGSGAIFCYRVGSGIHRLEIVDLWVF